MLKKFLLNILSSFVGTAIAIFVAGLAIVMLIVGLVARQGLSGSSPSVEKGSVLVLNLSGAIEETTKSPSLNVQDIVLSGGVETAQALDVIVEALAEAKDNDRIKALYLNCDGVSAGIATLNALREAVKDFKSSGKKVYAYGSGMAQGDYYVASVADSIFVNPEGAVALTGLQAQSLYFKDALDKLGIEFTVAKVGTFKSAVEPMLQNEMSAPARAQLDTLLGESWRIIRDEIAEARKIDASLIDSLINNDFIFLELPGEAQKAGLIDGLVYDRQMEMKLAAATGRDKAKDVKYTSLTALVSPESMTKDNGSKNQIAVLYATGEISESTDAGINCDVLVPVINNLAENDKVKALVLRVNSPGGSVYGSAQIAEALSYFQSKGKPFVVSMGDYAASGGYWISADADRIFANPLTITGSIGIFGQFPNVEGLLKKIGVTPNTVATNPEADFPSLFKRPTDRQMAALQKHIEAGYDRFVARVAKGRKMLESKVRVIAEGRVWSAASALRLGLVDEIGGLKQAIEWAAKKANILNDYNVGRYPDAKEDMINKLLRNNSWMKYLGTASGGKLTPELLQRVNDLLLQRPVQARMAEISINL